MKKIRLGLIGYGGICTCAHIPNYLANADKVEITAVCDIKKERLALAKEQLGLSDSALFTDYKELLASGLVDAVDIATSNDAHCEIAEAAIDYNLPFSLEKPIGRNYEEAKKLYDKAKASGIKSFICFSYRYNKYTKFLRDIVQSGELGKLYHINVRCIKDSGLWEGRRLEWRFDREKAGTGVLCDLGSHMIDITRFLGEEFETVSATRGIFVKERQVENGDEVMAVTTDDWANIIAVTKNDVPVTIQVSRVATTIPYQMEFEIMGEKGRVKYKTDFEESIEACIGKRDMEAQGTHKIVPPERYEGNQSLSFINMLNGIEDEYTSHLEEGIACQAVLEVAERAADTGRVIKISEEFKL